MKKSNAITHLFLDIGGVLHTDYTSTCAQLASFGFQTDEGATYETS